MSCNETKLTKKDFEIIFDVLNVYDPNDIMQVYPQMGEKDFLDGVQQAWQKVLEICHKNKKKHVK